MYDYANVFVIYNLEELNKQKMTHNALLLLAIGSFLPNNMIGWLYRRLRNVVKHESAKREGKPSIISLICQDLVDVVGHPFTFITVLLILVGVYVMLALQGYNKWNNGIGLFSNTNGSNFELLTGVGSMYLLAEARRQRKHDKADKAALHQKLDDLLRANGIDTDPSQPLVTMVDDIDPALSFANVTDEVA